MLVAPTADCFPTSSKDDNIHSKFFKQGSEIKKPAYVIKHDNVHCFPNQAKR